MSDRPTQTVPPTAFSLANALERIAREDAREEIYFDPRRGTLVARPANSGPPCDDALPATEMAREGFFGRVTEARW